MKNAGKAVRTQTLAALASHCEQVVLNLWLPCGGWGYARQWALEPTCLALLALRLRPKAESAKGLRFLESCQSPDGSWPGLEGDGEGSWATSLAVITLIRMGGDWPTIQRGCQWLLRIRGQESHWLAKWRYRLFDNKVRFDPEKYGWPWTVGAASWVVPTAYSLIALKLAFSCCLTDSARQRLDLGTAMLLDRDCTGGGWNAGNGVAFGIPLEPHADVTSLALIALLPHRNHPTVQASLSWLKNRLPTLNSLNSVSWTAMALATYGCDTSQAVEKLAGLAGREIARSEVEGASLCVLASHALQGVTCF
jgi:hypothetical protein